MSNESKAVTTEQKLVAEIFHTLEKVELRDLMHVLKERMLV